MKPLQLFLSQMEEPSYLSSSNKTTLCSQQHPSSSEESGWTSYLDDFCACSSILRGGGGGGGGSSVVSDASSCAAWKAQAAAEPLQRSCGNLSLKKKKGRKALEDSSLEDTASSPVNNRPKAGENSFLNVKTRKKRGNSKEKFSEKEMGREAINESEYDGRVKDEGSELRAKGLCLVPLSMLSNYLG